MKLLSQLTQPIRSCCFAGAWAALFAVASAQGSRPFPVAVGQDGICPPSPVEEFTVYGGAWTAEDGELEVGGGPGPKLVYQGPPSPTTKLAWSCSSTIAKAETPA